MVSYIVIRILFNHSVWGGGVESRCYIVIASIKYCYRSSDCSHLSCRRQTKIPTRTISLQRKTKIWVFRCKMIYFLLYRNVLEIKHQRTKFSYMSNRMSLKFGALLLILIVSRSTRRVRRNRFTVFSKCYFEMQTIIKKF